MKSANQVMVVSNHYVLKTKNLSFNEFHVRFIRQADVGTLQSNPEFFDNEAVETGAREKIHQIIKANKPAIVKEIGEFNVTGVTLFNFKKVQKKQFVFTEHPEFVVILKLTNDNIGNDKLVANENCRVPVLRCLNTYVKQMMKNLRMVEFGRQKKYYNVEKDIKLDLEGVKISLFKGFKTAFEVYASGPRLVVNYVCRVVREKTVLQEFNEQSGNFSDKETAALELIVGKTAITTYGNHRPYVIDGVDFKKKATDAFPDKKFKNFIDYFQTKYKVNITAKDQFMLYSINKVRQPDKSFIEETIWLLPELLRPTGLTDQMRKNFKMMQILSRETIRGPSDRFSMTNEHVKRINDELVKNGGLLELDTKEPQVPALQLVPPQIFGNQKTVFSIRKDRIDVSAIAEPCKITNWVMVYEKSMEENSYVIVENFAKACKKFAIQYSDPTDYVVLQKMTTAENILNMVETSKCKKPSIVMFFVSKRSASERTYSSIKRVFDSKGIPTQFFVSFNPHKDTMGLAKYSNILLQMANKMKHNLWYIKCQAEKALILGADVCHAQRGNSVAAVVGMWGDFLEESYSTSALHRQNQEVMHNLAQMVIEITEQYVVKSKDKAPPKSIIFYRDGVGEGQLAEVTREEVNTIKNMLKQKYAEKAPKLMFIVVTKRLDDRFAMKFDRNLDNPDSGLIVYKDVVKKDLYQFFMVSQKVTQGTATPTSYEIILDELGLDPTVFYNMTYHQTFNYYNWMGPIKVPAAVQYAHKACEQHLFTMDTNVPKDFKETKYYM